MILLRKDALLHVIWILSEEI